MAQYDYCSIWTTSTHSGSLRNYTNGVIQVTLLECKMRLKNNMEWKNGAIAEQSRASVIWHLIVVGVPGSNPGGGRIFYLTSSKCVRDKMH